MSIHFYSIYRKVVLVFRHMTPEYLNLFSFVNQISSKTTRRSDRGILYLTNFELIIICGLLKYLFQFFGINCLGLLLRLNQHICQVIIWIGDKCLCSYFSQWYHAYISYYDDYFLHVYVYICDYYTSEEFFLYKTTLDKWTIHHFSRQNELLPVHSFLLLHSYDVLAFFMKSWHLID